MTSYVSLDNRCRICAAELSDLTCSIPIFGDSSASFCLQSKISKFLYITVSWHHQLCKSDCSRCKDNECNHFGRVFPAHDSRIRWKIKFKVVWNTLSCIRLKRELIDKSCQQNNLIREEFQSVSRDSPQKNFYAAFCIMSWRFFSSRSLTHSSYVSGM